MAQPSQAQAIETLKHDLAVVQEELRVTRAHIENTHKIVERLQQALLEVQPGHERSLLDRLGAAVIKIERGENGIKFVMWAAGLVVAVGGAWAMLKNGIGPHK